MHDDCDAHRLSTVKKCDLIYEMAEGKIIASGDFQQLQERSPSFREMALIEASESSMVDFIVLATADWDHPLWTNKQHTALTLAAAGNRVLYVESLGIRPPRVGSADRRRIFRRLRRLLQLPRQRREGLWVWSPPVLPGGHSGWVLQLNRQLLQSGLVLACRWLGFRDPILWTYNPLTTLYLNP